MWVIKLGGSLLRSPQLPAWLDALARHGGGRAVIVPGGGPFADLVRSEQARVGFDDDAAHWMAILAMEQFGFLLEALRESFCSAATEEQLRDVLGRGQVPVWLAYPMVAREESLPRSWDVSADSLALWLAQRLDAEALLLVKSVSPDVAGADFPALAAAGLVDAYFPRLAREYRRPIRILGPDAAAQAAEALRSGRLPGSLLLAGA